jgi:hypothetical protein
MIMKKFFLSAVFFSVIAVSGFGQEISNDFFELAKMRTNVKNRRVSSSDKTGGSDDRIINIKPGNKEIIFDVKGAGVINHIWFTIAPLPDKLNRNDIILRMYWDGNAFPSVESPIGPFFGQGWNERYNFSSLPLIAGPAQGTGLVSYFAMPFANGAKIEIENQTNQDISSFFFYVDYVEVPGLAKDVGRFHAWYNHELTDAAPEGETEWNVNGKIGLNPDGKNNYVFADIQGKGHFVGINYYVHCPSPMWYGEGDDMWYIDGETFPRLSGTGTEDFFNTSWSPKEVFQHPYYGYPRVNNDAGWLGRTHVYRFFINDPVFFEKSLKGTIEHGGSNNMTLDIGTVAYWYQSEAAPLPPAPSKEARQPKSMIGPVELHRWRHEWRKSHGNGSTLWGNEE